ncbi:cephalosporin hydroxylase family protein [Prochlorothrix hollandica]|uniref:Cephalosporin hydroxylase n=1 Tax=Prochlorothrix hollandica PCC 9006 = CALU 1027 TaxID=317619 RepID=A0A0M2PXM3_PROHO|nr:CmcI family methyltransferase [Prochlorothrix hollandica]KKI99136.1 cephalosporin hydroxylase [Prochlorothrix hollandica PCC 9006 = CALU 1027]
MKDQFYDLTQQWLCEAISRKYAYGFTWLNQKIIQIPQDIYAIQEIIWRIKPDLIIETGVAHGGSLILSASMLALIDYCEAISSNQKSLDLYRPNKLVIGVDIEIRRSNRDSIETHPLSKMIELVEGSSTDLSIIDHIKSRAKKSKKILVFLDSNHTHNHVLQELKAYAPLVSIDSYCVVWDTGIEDLPSGFITDRPWGKGNNPKTAVIEYLRELESGLYRGLDNHRLKFVVDHKIEDSIIITAAPHGFLKRVKVL